MIVDRDTNQHTTHNIKWYIQSFNL